MMLDFQGSVSISGDTANWYASNNIYFLPTNNVNLANKTITPFSGALQELRYYNTNLSQSAFRDFTLNPYSYLGNQFDTTPDHLAFRVGFGTLLQTASVENVASVHPKYQVHGL